MMIENMRYLILILLFLNIFVFIYLLVKNYFESGYANTSGNSQNTQITIPTTRAYKDTVYSKRKLKLLERIESIIVKSNIRRLIPVLNSYIVIAISLCLGGAAFAVTYNFLNNGITSIVFFIAFSLIPVYILENLSSYYSSKIERNFLYFLNILSNFAQLKDDVYFAFDKSVGYVDEPLNSFCKTFIEEVKRGIPVEDALENFKDKIDNGKFKLFLKNAQLCVKFGGSFLKLASNNLESVKQLEIEKARRKSETAFGKGLIYFMMAINIAVAVYMFNLYPNTLDLIQEDFYGQLIILINTINLFIVFYLSLKLQKLDY